MCTLTRLLVVLSALVLLALCVLHYGVLPYYDHRNNAVIVAGPYAVSNNIREFHQQAFVADMHADSLLWGRDLRERQSRGHVDLPRLSDGGVDLQVFGVVNKVPGARNYTASRGDTDSLPILFFAAWRRPGTWFNPMERALAQAEELRRLAEDTPLTLVFRRDDLFIEGTRGLLALEGMHMPLDKDALLELYEAGFRMIGLAHYTDNAVAGSAHGVDKHGLTAPGRSLVPEMEALGITIDLAHASSAAFEETLALAKKPVVVSHGGVLGTCPGTRNLSDEQLRSIAGNGGVIGIGYFKAAVCDASLEGITAAILYAIKIAGVDHVGLGSDFDGNVATPFDVTGLPMLTESLLAAGLSGEEVGKVLGGNVRRVLEANLPE